MLKEIQIIGYSFIYIVKIKKISMKTLVNFINESLKGKKIRNILI